MALFEAFFLIIKVELFHFKKEGERMNFKEILYKRKIKQIELAKQLNLDTSKVSLCVNGVTPFPKKYHQKLSEILQVPLKSLSDKKKDGGQ